jgi:hypothetical protein
MSEIMKKNIYISTIFILTIIFSFGCKKITDINVSPNNPPLSKATPQVLFPSGVAASAGMIGGELNILGAIWSQYYTQNNLANQYRNIDSYNLTKEDLNNDYSVLFAGALEDYQLAITQSKANQQWSFFLMNTVMKAYTYEVLVDLYDMVPYSQAFMGQANTQPKFDDGHTIYDALIAEIDFALTQNYNVALNAGDASTDFLFAGDMTKWAEFAHTLELKMYLRMAKNYPSEAQAGVQKLYANPDFLSVDAGMNNFVNQPSLDNPFYEYNIRSLNTTTNLRASTTFVSFLENTQDPRVISYFGVANPISINQGDFNNTTNSTYANAVSPLQTPLDPVWFISAAESYFLQAEALVRYYGGGAPAQAAYVAGVTASFAANNVTSTNAVTFINNSTDPNVNWALSTNKIQTIIVQKWVSLAQGCHALEAFFDQSRTGYPLNSPVYSTSVLYVPGQWVYAANGVTSGLFPKRLVFPAVETERNKNTPPQVPITTPVWWAK